jgi:anti-sigma factor RsiW
MLGSREGELRDEERAALASHVEACAACRARLADLRALDGLVGEALLRAAAARDFSSFADGIMARVERRPARLLAFLRRHRIAVRVVAAAAPALAAAALIVYLGGLASGETEPDLEVSSESYAPIVISTADGPMVLLGEEPEGT